MNEKGQWIEVGEEHDEAALERAVSILEDGGLVVLPTETVYGVFARAAEGDDPAAIYHAKARPSERKLPLAVASRRHAQGFVGALPPAASALTRSFWPGPLTLVVGEGAGLALRCPDHAFTRAVLERVSAPLWATSANRSGEPAATSAAEARAALGDSIDLYVEAGPARSGVATTVLRVPAGPGPLQILRAGEVDAPSIAQKLRLAVLIVCTGNTCRSPLAEVLLRQEAERVGLPLTVSSAGLAAALGEPASDHSRTVAAERNLDLEAHQARRVDRESLRGIDLVLATSESHLEALSAPLRDKVALELLDPSGRGLPDPFGSPLEVYRATGEAIAEACALRVTAWQRDLSVQPGPV